jgi:SAM-dependent methyltransferase
LQENLGITVDFKDHFSAQSDGYAKYRPTYPDELFRFLASVASSHTAAWDCATGNGQVATALANYFSTIVATDASQSQIDAALAHPGVDYRVAAAEQSGLAENSIDLISVGQALHWFDQERFMLEAKRVLKPEGVLAIWCYELCSVSPDCDAIVDTLYRDIVADFWPPERAMIEQGYAAVDMPGVAIGVPDFEMSLTWHASDMIGYLRTWSACKRYEQAHGSDPVARISAALSVAWGEVERRVTWPLQIKASRANTLVE